MEEQGLVMVNTGNGKGKTTAAFGQALRVAGHDQLVCIIQFIKGNWPTGESLAVARLADCVELYICGTGFTWKAESRDEVILAALQGWRLAKEKIASGSFRLIVLDELTYPINYGIISEDEVLAVLSSRPAGLDVLITGREAGAGLLAVADLVTEMREIKHPFRKGIAARQGIEY
jgi:cob(I)alamin adenosyltransferase